MQGLCISLDVSKGSSYYQGFTSMNEPVGKAKKIEHDDKGFKELSKLKERMEIEYEDEVKFVFESTGIYHKTLQTYLDDNNYSYIIISPLLSAKVRKSDIRGTKTDKKDCSSIANVFYLKKLKTYGKAERIYDDLREKSRYYDFLMDEMKRWKVEFRRLLDVIYPGFDKVFNELYCDYTMEILKQYHHPDEIRKRRVDTIASFIEKKTCHKGAFALKQAEALKNYASSCHSGCDKDSYLCEQLETVIRTLDGQIKHLDEVLEEIVETAKKLPEYESIRSIPGIGDNLASRILAELGDASRFTNSSQVVAYAGIDPNIYQSGEISGEHLRISKKGNKKLRCLLYLAVTCMIKVGKADSILRFYQKKKQQGLAPKAAKVAAMNKLLRIIYSLIKNKATYQ